jgi:hypothetical protein
VSETTEADLQLLKASNARIERDVDRLDRKFDTFLTAHQQTHQVEQSAFNAHLLTSADSMSRSSRHDIEIPAIDKRVEAIETWWHEFRGAMGFMRLTFGTSILASIIAIITLGVLVSGLVK